MAKEEQEEKEKEEASLINSRNKGQQSVWQVVCFTQQDWSRLVEKFRDSVMTVSTKNNIHLCRKKHKIKLSILIFPGIRHRTQTLSYIIRGLHA